MIRDPITMFCYSDFSGRVRGKGIPARELRRRLEKGIGWTPTNIMITAYGPIADTPWGPFGDLLLMPDPKTEVLVDFEDGTPPEHFFLSDVVETDLSPWAVCPRTFLRNTLARLKRETGLEVVVAFEHEFLYSGANERPATVMPLMRCAAPVRSARCFRPRSTGPACPLRATCRNMPKGSSR